MKTILKTIFLAAALIIALPTLAQTTGDLRLTTSPLPINIKTTPGSNVSALLKIKNDGNQKENLKVDVMKFKADSITGAPQLLEREAGDDFFDWVTFSEKNFQIDSNEWKTITADFKIPDTASYGYYYAIVFARADQQVPTGERQTVLSGGTATLVLINVEVPGAKRQLEIENFSVSKNIFEFLPTDFNVKIRNSGNVHVSPKGNIFLSRGNKNDVAILDVNAGQGSILPNSPREFNSQWNDGFPVYQEKIENGQPVLDKDGKPTYELKWNWKDASKLRWGKYTAKLVMVYDDGQRDVPIEGEVSFWVVPWRLGAYAFLIIFVPSLVVYLFMKWRMKKLRKQYEK
jgi:hypothetical protein